MSKSKIAVVTGADGFIGKHLVEELKKDDVTEVREFEGDVRIALQVDHWVKELHLDRYRSVTLYHLASYGNKSFQQDVPRIYDTNVTGTAILLEAFPDRTNMVFASSSSVYGYRTSVMKEDDQPAPNSHYAMSKVAAEYMVKLRRGTVLRLFSVYGHGEAGYRLIPTVRRKLLSGEPFDTANKNAVRDFVHVSDVVRAFIQLKGLPSTFNVCNGREWSVQEVFDIACQALGVKDHELLENPTGANRRPWESERWFGDPRRAVEFGWDRKVHFLKGLHQYMLEG